MNIRFLPPLADMNDYPAPEFSMLPGKRAKTWKAKRPVLANADPALPISYARNGLAIIAKALLAPGSKVLVPAYHCPALVEPFVWAQCEVVFYPLNEDLSPDIETITHKLPTAEAIVFVPFFGFEQDIAKLAALARLHNCLPIEDLAHAAHTNILHGDYGVTSLQKFYPVATGGELLISNTVVNTRVFDLWKASHIRQWRRLVRKSFTKFFMKLGSESTWRRPSRDGFRYFDPSIVGEPISCKDSKQITSQDHANIAVARRNNYQILDKFLRQSLLGRPLYLNLGPNNVPYVYPFVLEKAEYFDLIRNMAIPLYRWEEICPSDCKTSDSYRSLLIQFPCHQDMDKDDLDRLISKLVVAESTVK